MIREHRKNTMIRKAYWGVLASTVAALALLTGCSSTSATPPVTPITTVATMAPFRQTQLENTTYVAPLTAVVTTSANGVGTGTPVGGVTVTFTVSPSPGGAGATFANGTQSTTASTDATTGIAVSTALTSNGTPGSFTVIASTAGTTSTAIFSVVNTLTPVTFTSTAGDGQSATVSTNFGTALKATVVDGSNKPVVGIVVTFTAPSTGASGTFVDSLSNVTTAITDSNGVATAATFAANATAGGPYTVAATVPVVQSATAANDTWLTTNFSLTNTP